jgi:hypothetical protein
MTPSLPKYFWDGITPLETASPREKYMWKYKQQTNCFDFLGRHLPFALQHLFLYDLMPEIP